MSKKVAIIGAGFSGLSSACYLAKKGFDVTIFDKHDKVGGRNRQFDVDGFKFDTGPSWYWMPDVFEQFFADFNTKPSDFYELVKLNPSFSIFYKDDKLDIPANEKELPDLFEKYEKGAGERFNKFMKSAKLKYEIGMNDFVQKPSKSIFEFINLKAFLGSLKLSIFSKFDTYVRRFFKHPYLVQLMEFPILFLGSAPHNTPALYSLMNYAGLMLGTWYPKGGMHEIVLAMEKVALQNGVKIVKSTAIEKINVDANQFTSLKDDNGNIYAFDALVSSGDYAHMEQLLDKQFRNYDDAYWDSRVFAPSSLLFYLGFDKKIDGLEHHNLFFDEDLYDHAEEIYETKKWPKKPLFYACIPSKSDDLVAPQGKENVFLLMPLAAGVNDTEELRLQYFNVMMDRLEKRLGTDLKNHVIYKKGYCVKDFENDYNAYKGNAYGLANTIKQTAFLKPKLNNKKIKNIVYAGQLTVPGPGMPPAIISGKLAAEEIEKYFKNH